MDEYRRLADQYFRLTEGVGLYPGLRSWHWYVWIVTLVVFLSGLGYATSRRSSWIDPGLMIIAFEIPFLLCCVAIEQFKQRALAIRLSAGGTASAELHKARRQSLEQICSMPATEFAKLAKECADLHALSKVHAIRPVFSMTRLLGTIYDRDSKARVLALGLAGLATFVALLNKSLPEPIDVMAVVSDGGAWQFVGLFCFVAFIVFVVCLGLVAAARQVGSFLRLWWARVTATSAARDVAITHFIHDLVRYHQPPTQQRSKIDIARIRFGGRGNVQRTRASCCRDKILSQVGDRKIS